VGRYLTSAPPEEVLDQPVDDCVPQIALSRRHGHRKRILVRSTPNEVLGCNIRPAASLRQDVVNPDAAIETVGDHGRDAAAPLKRVCDPDRVVSGRAGEHP